MIDRKKLKQNLFKLTNILCFNNKPAQFLLDYKKKHDLP